MLIKQARQDLEKIFAGAAGRTTGLGVAMPGPFGKSADSKPTGNDDAYSMAVWQQFPLVEHLKARSGLDVTLQNDAAAATIAEKLNGTAYTMRNVVCFYFGFGLGSRYSHQWRALYGCGWQCWRNRSRQATWPSGSGDHLGAQGLACVIVQDHGVGSVG